MSKLDERIQTKMKEISGKIDELINICKNYIQRIENILNSGVNAPDFLKKVQSAAINNLDNTIKQLNALKKNYCNLKMPPITMLFYLVDERMMVHSMETLLKQDELVILKNERDVIFEEFKNELPPNSTLTQDPFKN